MSDQSEAALTWLRTRIEESRESYNVVVAKYPDSAALRDLRWAIGHAVVASEVVGDPVLRKDIEEQVTSGEALTDTREALESMVYQFGYWNDSAGGFTAGGLSALEYAFEVLGWEDPRPAPEVRCDEPGCMHQISMGTPTPQGYRRTCFDHRPKESEA